MSKNKIDHPLHARLGWRAAGLMIPLVGLGAWPAARQSDIPLWGLLLAAALLVTVCGVLGIQGLVTRPLRDLIERVQRALPEPEEASAAEPLRGDEIGLLGRDIDRLVARSRLQQNELERAAPALKDLRRLEQDQEEMERYYAKVAHDLSSPLVTIFGFTSLLEKDLAGQRHERIQRDLDRIRGAAEQMKLLVDELSSPPPAEPPPGELTKSSGAPALAVAETRTGA